MAPPPHSLTLPLITLLSLLTVVNSTFSELLAPIPPHTGNLCDELIIPQGYPCVQHSVQTKDGYILAVQRVSSSSSSHKLSSHRRPPVLLLHGVLAAGECWFLNQKNESLGYILADKGFDVWAANFRGTRLSSEHVSLSDKSKEYWDWSWEELTRYDLAAMVEHIYKETGTKIFVVGHSLGTTISMYAFTEPKMGIVQKVEAAAFFCPITYLAHLSAPLILKMIYVHYDQMLVELGQYRVDLRSALEINLLNSICIKGHLDCGDLLATISDCEAHASRSFTYPWKECCINNSRVNLYLEYEPHPQSIKNMKHFFQMVRHGTFAKYDYGMLENMRRYGSLKPPTIDLSLVPKSLPVWIGYGKHDYLAVAIDVNRTIAALPCKKEILCLENYGHADFVYGVRAKDDVYPKMIEFFNSWKKNSN